MLGHMRHTAERPIRRYRGPHDPSHAKGRNCSASDQVRDRLFVFLPNDLCADMLTEARVCASRSRIFSCLDTFSSPSVLTRDLARRDNELLCRKLHWNITPRVLKSLPAFVLHPGFINFFKSFTGNEPLAVTRADHRLCLTREEAHTSKFHHVVVNPRR